MQSNLRAIDKKLINTLSMISLLIISLISNNLSAQSTATIYTPNGTSVTALILTEFTQSQIASINAQAAIEFPNAQIIDDASNKYNCHAYAWYLSECISCTKYWINTPEEDKYWTDESYLEVASCLGSKISYASDDHSAVKSVVTGKFDSKWGQYPLMRHDPTYTPYNSTNLKYYLLNLPVIGPSSLCMEQKTYTIQNVPAGATVSWTASPISSFSVISGSGTSFSTGAKNSTTLGAGSIVAHINGGCSTTSFGISVMLGGIQTFSNQTWNTNQTITDCKVTLTNITVQGSANVEINTGSELIINGTFNAPVGTTLNFE